MLLLLQPFERVPSDKSRDLPFRLLNFRKEAELEIEHENHGKVNNDIGSATDTQDIRKTAGRIRPQDDDGDTAPKQEPEQNLYKIHFSGTKALQRFGQSKNSKEQQDDLYDG